MDSRLDGMLLWRLKAKQKGHSLCAAHVQPVRRPCEQDEPNLVDEISCRCQIPLSESTGRSSSELIIRTLRSEFANANSPLVAKYLP